MKIYTKNGDTGLTSLYDGKIMAKEEIFFSVLGEIEELNARIGLLYCLLEKEEFTKKEENKPFLYLHKIQLILHDIFTSISSIKENRKYPDLNPEILLEIESHIDFIESKNTKLTKIILPGTGLLDAHVQLCRTQTKKVERKLWKIHRCNKKVDYGEKLTCDATSHLIPKQADLSEFLIDNSALRFLNRLSDFFFVLARFIAKIQKLQEFFKQ